MDNSLILRRNEVDNDKFIIFRANYNKMMNRNFSCEDSRRYLFSPDTADSRHGICIFGV